MNENPTPKPVSSAPAPEVVESFETLQRQFQTVLLILIVLVAVLDCYMWRQWRLIKGEVRTIEPQAMQIAAQYQSVTLPLAKNFSGQLAAYSKTHADFLPIWTNYVPVLTKMGLLAAPGAAAPAAAAQPAKSPAAAPAATPQPPKAAAPAPAKAPAAAPAPAPKK